MPVERLRSRRDHQLIEADQQAGGHAAGPLEAGILKDPARRQSIKAQICPRHKGLIHRPFGHLTALTQDPGKRDDDGNDKQKWQATLSEQARKILGLYLHF